VGDFHSRAPSFVEHQHSQIGESGNDGSEDDSHHGSRFSDLLKCSADLLDRFDALVVDLRFLFHRDAHSDDPSVEDGTLRLKGAGGKQEEP
jgi:hypothetical protein